MQYRTKTEVQCAWLTNVNPAYIWALRARRNRAEKEQYKSRKLLQTANTVLDKLTSEGEPAEISRKLWTIGRRIRMLEQGIGPAEGVAPVQDNRVDLGGDEGRVANDVLARTLAKALYRFAHPDRGGDPLLFQQIVDAVALRDVGLLQYLTATYTKVQDRGWLYGEGLEFWNTQVQVWKSRSSLIRSNPLYLCVSFYLSGNVDQAVNTLTDVLRKRLQLREAELINLLTNHGDLDGNEKD